MRHPRGLIALALVLAACAPALPSAPRQIDPIVAPAERGALGTVLTADGQTLYRFTRDRPGESRCVDRCAQDWPPVIVTRHPDTRGDLPGRFGSSRRDDGRRQLTYDGVPLYLYIEDAPQSDDANGQDVDHEWYVIHP